MSAADPPISVTLPQSVWLAIAEQLAACPYAQVAHTLEAFATELRPKLRAVESTPIGAVVN